MIAIAEGAGVGTIRGTFGIGIRTRKTGGHGICSENSR
jgi:hypothetical protein